jgi:hypothetical protein
MHHLILENLHNLSYHRSDPLIRRIHSGIKLPRMFSTSHDKRVIGQRNPPREGVRRGVDLGDDPDSSSQGVGNYVFELGLGVELVWEGAVFGEVGQGSDLE